MLKVIKKRRSIRKYQEKEIEEDKLKEILRAAMFSPSAHDERPWEFVVVRSQKTKDLLAKTQKWSDFVNQAPVILVLCSREVSYWVENLSIVAENIYLEAANQGLGTCFVQIREMKALEGGDAEEYIRRILSIPQNIRVLCLMPVGYPAEQKEEHTDLEFEKAKIHWEKF
jgi:nitroreductase